MGRIDRGRGWLLALAVAWWAGAAYAASPGPFQVDGQAYAFDNPAQTTPLGSQLQYPIACVSPTGGTQQSILTGAGPAVWRTLTLDSTEGAFYVQGGPQVPYPVLQSEGAGFTQGNLLMVGPVDSTGTLKVFTEMFVDSGSSHAVGVFDLTTGALDQVAITYGYPVALIDVNGDGVPEAIVLNDPTYEISAITVMDAQLTHTLYSAPITFPPVSTAFAVGHFDTSGQAEIVTSAGLVYQLTATGMTQVGTIPATINSQTINLLAAGDVNGDGIDEIIAVYGPATVVAYSFSTQTVLWQRTPTLDSTDLMTSLSVLDLTGSGQLQVLAGQQSDNPAVQLGGIYVFNGATGAQQLAFAHPDQGLSSLTACDVDGTGTLDLVSEQFVVNGPARLYVNDPQTGAQIYRSNEELGPVEGVVVADVEGTGNPDAVFMPNGIVGVGDLALHARNAETFVRTWDTPSPFLPVLGTDALATLTAGNAAGDGHTDLVAGSAQNGIGIIWVIDGPTRTLKETIQLDSGDLVEAVALADLGATGTPQIVAGVLGTAGPRLEVIDGSTGTRLWHVAIGTENLAILKLKVADLTNNGHDDVIVHMASDLNGSPEIYVLNGATQAIGSLPITNVSAFESIVVSATAALDLAIAHGDGTIELVNSSSAASLTKYTACASGMNALSRDNLSTAGAEEVLFTCGQQIGWMSLATGATQLLTANVGNFLGLSDNLFSLGTSPSTDRIIVNSNIGIAHLSPTANLAPYVYPIDSATTNTFSGHWTNPAGGVVTFGTFDGTPSTLKLVSQATHGTVTVAGTGFEYQANGPYQGPDSFVVQASTAQATSAPTTILMIMTESAPFMNPDTASLSVTPGGSGTLTIPVQGGGGPLTFQIVQAPAKGTVKLDGNQAIYTANAGTSGTDTFSVRAFDELDYSDPLVVTVTIAVAAPPPTPPPTPPPAPSSGGGGGGGGVDPLTLGILIALALTHLKRKRREHRPGVSVRRVNA